MTYFKVPLKGMKAGLTMNLLPLGPETNWKLRPEDVADALSDLLDWPTSVTPTTQRAY